MKKAISTILTEIDQLPTREEQIQAFREAFSVPLGMVLRYGLDPSVTWLLPKGPPPYKPCEQLDQEATLYNKSRELYLFVEGPEIRSTPGKQNVKKMKREIAFINMLESIDPADAKLLIAAKDGEFTKHFETIDVDLVREALPGLILG